MLLAWSIFHRSQYFQKVFEKLILRVQEFVKCFQTVPFFALWIDFTCLYLNPRWRIVHTIKWSSQVAATEMPTLDDIVAGAKDTSKQQLQEALLELLKGNPDIFDPVTKSTTRTHSEVVSVFFDWLSLSCRWIIGQDKWKIISDIFISGR